MFNLAFMTNFCLNYERRNLVSCCSHLSEATSESYVLECMQLFECYEYFRTTINQIMDLITKSPGLQHIAEKIFVNLDTHHLDKCKHVNENWKNIFDNPLFLFKACIQKGLLSGKEQDIFQKVIPKITNSSNLSDKIIHFLDPQSCMFCYKKCYMYQNDNGFIGFDNPNYNLSLIHI